MKKIFYGLFLLSLFSCGQADRVNHEYKGKNYHCEYQTTDGRIEGHYISYYNNDEVKAEGYFTNGYHSGNWKLWDSTGLVVERYYKNPFSCEIIIPETLDRSPDSVYQLIKNEFGIYPSFDVKEKMIIAAKRIWRYLPLDKNPILKKSDLFTIWQQAIVDGKYLYKEESSLQMSGVGKFIFNSTNTQLLGYKIVEDFFYDNQRNVSEKRILGISPVVLGKDGDTTTFPWIFLPHIRKELASVSLKESESIQNLDDLFFFRYFSSIIYKEERIYSDNRKFPISGEKVKKQSEKIEMDLIDNEHDYWINKYTN